ncbi:hypothetical protein FACS189446_8720 [Bacteroidia bacterium]|nr:hypothetical protein FACS189446_8720 [Bacteroidia bacterium]
MINKEQLDFLNRQSRDDLYILLRKALSELNSIESLQEQAEAYRRKARKIQQQEVDNEIGARDFLIVSIIFFALLLMLIHQLQMSILFLILPLAILAISIFKYRKSKSLKIESGYEYAKAVQLDTEAQEKLGNTEFLPLLPKVYCYTLAAETMVEIIGNGRAKTWQELADRYEEQYYRWQLQEDSRKMLELQIRQAEIAEQTLQQTRKTADWAAIGAIGSLATAAGVGRINSKL